MSPLRQPVAYSVVGVVEELARGVIRRGQAIERIVSVGDDRADDLSRRGRHGHGCADTPRHGTVIDLAAPELRGVVVRPEGIRTEDQVESWRADFACPSGAQRDK